MRRSFDNAATTFPKPPGVADAVAAYLRDNGAPAGRGAYRAALDVERIVARGRSSAARLFDVPDPRRVIFTFNGTDSLNLAILGLCRPGDHVVSSTWEHNSVLRPLRWLADHCDLAVTLLEPIADGRIDPAAVRAALRPATRLVAIQHASNVIGVIQPIADLADIVRQHGAFFLVDAAQSAGHVPIDLSQTPIDLLACSGHKGLLGPLGTGLLVVGDRVADELQPLRFGGTGTVSEDDRQPTALPEKFESGNHNVPGLVGLDAALTWIHDRSVKALHAHEIAMTEHLWDGLAALSGVTLFGPAPRDVPRTGVISLQLNGLAPQDAAAVLDDHYDLATRAGLHCAPGVHRSLGTIDTGGTLRMSPGPFTSEDDVAAAIAAVRDITSAM
jgi:cysteine desulfurase/selenocysteine lyase